MGSHLRKKFIEVGSEHFLHKWYIRMAVELLPGAAVGDHLDSAPQFSKQFVLVGPCVAEVVPREIGTLDLCVMLLAIAVHMARGKKSEAHSCYVLHCNTVLK